MDVSCDATVCCCQVHADWAGIVEAAIKADVEERLGLVGADLDAVEEDLEHGVGSFRFRLAVVFRADERCDHEAESEGNDEEHGYKMMPKGKYWKRIVILVCLL